MKLIKILNYENVSDEELKDFKTRRVSRVVALDDNNKIAINYMVNNKYYELPGGGVEEYETYEEGLIREAKEEAGVNLEIIKEIGIVQEYRRYKTFINESHAYLAKVVGEKGGLSLTEGEKEEGMTVLWVDLEKAERLITSNHPENKDVTEEMVRYTKERDLAILEEARKLIKEIN